MTNSEIITGQINWSKTSLNHEQFGFLITKEKNIFPALVEKELYDLHKDNPHRIFSGIKDPKTSHIFIKEDLENDKTLYAQNIYDDFIDMIKNWNNHNLTILKKTNKRFDALYIHKNTLYTIKINKGLADETIQIFEQNLCIAFYQEKCEENSEYKEEIPEFLMFFIKKLKVRFSKDFAEKYYKLIFSCVEKKQDFYGFHKDFIETASFLSQTDKDIAFYLIENFVNFKKQNGTTFQYFNDTAIFLKFKDEDPIKTRINFNYYLNMPNTKRIKIFKENYIE